MKNKLDETLTYLECVATNLTGEAVCEEDERVIEHLMQSVEYIDLAKECVKKAMPVIPYTVSDGYADGELVVDYWECPACGLEYDYDGEIFDYCPACGQAIDWEKAK